MTETKKTALNRIHRKLGAKMVDFAGWDMPVSYSGTLEEHNTVREKVGIFDVSHMGEIEITGKNALRQVQKITCNDAGKLDIGQAQYSALLYPEGTFVDDMLVHKIDDSHYMLCVNSANKDKDYRWIVEKSITGADIKDKSDAYSQIAVQGPNSPEVLENLLDFDTDNLGYYRFKIDNICGTEGIIARTGYTGEDGFELYIDPGSAEKVWNALMEEGESYGIKPAGLGARDTLRLEASMCLYGNDIDDETTPFEAGLGWIVSLDKDDFTGKDALLKQKKNGVSRKLIGFELLVRGVPRHGYSIFADGERAGEVTSGTYAPYLKKGIGMGYVPTGYTSPGTGLEIEIRNSKTDAKIVKKPFYKR